MKIKILKKMSLLLLIVSSVLVVISSILYLTNGSSSEVYNAMYSVSFIGIGIALILLGIYQLIKDKK